MSEYVPDPIERGEARADRYEDRIHGDFYTCSCGDECRLYDAQPLSADPYAEPFCPECVQNYIDASRDVHGDDG